MYLPFYDYGLSIAKTEMTLSQSKSKVNTNHLFFSFRLLNKQLVNQCGLHASLCHCCSSTGPILNDPYC